MTALVGPAETATPLTRRTLIILVAASLAALIDLPRPLLHLGAGLAGPLILFIATLALMKRTDWLTHEHHA